MCIVFFIILFSCRQLVLRAVDICGNSYTAACMEIDVLETGNTKIIINSLILIFKISNFKFFFK